jgi:aryl-alcohol dehydrogenase-like predicted oxidoreductase
MVAKAFEAGVNLFDMADDPATPMEEMRRALEDLVRQRYVRYVGVSNWAAWQIAKALGISAHLGLSRFSALAWA